MLAMPVFGAHAQSFTDISPKTFEYTAINSAVSKGWIKGLSDTQFGYGKSIAPDDWLYMLMFLRTDDACPEWGKSPNQYWTAQNIRACLSGTGVPVQTASTLTIRRDEAMRQLFALRRRSFAFQALQSSSESYSPPSDFSTIEKSYQGAMTAADRLKLLFRSSGKIRPAESLLREDAVYSLYRFNQWESLGGVDTEVKATEPLAKNATLNHFRDLDTDVYVIEFKSGGDAYLQPILPRRSFSPAKDLSDKSVRSEFVYQTVSELAKESGALAAVNGSYFNIDWPWGALEDTLIVDGKSYLTRTDRSTFVICKDGRMFIGMYSEADYKKQKCTVAQAIGAGPVFMQSGSIVQQNTSEAFDEYTQWERRVGKNARTAVAVSADHKTAYIITVAGNDYPAFGTGGESLGSYLKQKFPNIYDAMMLDGGGSTSLYANDKALVSAGKTDGTERRVVSALGVFSKTAQAKLAKAYNLEKAKRWDPIVTPLKFAQPTSSLTWLNIDQAATGDNKDIQIIKSGSRGTRITWLSDDKNKAVSQSLTFDQFIKKDRLGILLTRRIGIHQLGFTIPVELNIIDRKDASATDIIKLFAYLPSDNQPDLKTFDVVMFTKTGMVFGDAPCRYWYYYPKLKQLSPAKFVK